MLNIKQLHQYYGGSHILRGVSLEAKLGQVTVILGRNGVGKTTLLKSIMGLVPIRSGEISFNGQAIEKMPTVNRVLNGIAYVPQGREIFSRLTVEENLLMGLSGKSAKTAIPTELFELFPVLDQMRHRKGGDLSGGQQQQLAIARALAAEPKVLILDEPTEGIQPSIIKDIGRIIQLIASRGNMAIILVEQYYDFAESLADQFYVMDRGEMVAQGAGNEMQARGIKHLVSI